MMEDTTSVGVQILQGLCAEAAKKSRQLNLHLLHELRLHLFAPDWRGLPDDVHLLIAKMVWSTIKDIDV